VCLPATLEDKKRLWIEFELWGGLKTVGYAVFGAGGVMVVG
jgi:hypothetical protein